MALPGRTVRQPVCRSALTKADDRSGRPTGHEADERRFLSVASGLPPSHVTTRRTTATNEMKAAAVTRPFGLAVGALFACRRMFAPMSF